MEMRRVWEWCAKWLPEDQTDRFLVVTVGVSVILHVLVGMVLIMGGNLEQQRIASKRGEALLVDIAPDKPKETAPLGDPSHHAGPSLPEPASKAASPSPESEQSQTAKPSPQPQPAQPQPPAPAANPRVASVPPQPPPPAGMFRRGGGGGLKGGRGG